MPEPIGEGQDAVEFAVQIMRLALAHMEQQVAKHELQPGQLSSVAQLATAMQSLKDSTLGSSAMQTPVNQPDHTHPCFTIANDPPTLELRSSDEQAAAGGQERPAACQSSDDTQPREVTGIELDCGETQKRKSIAQMVSMDTRALTSARERLLQTKRLAHVFQLVDLNGDGFVGRYELLMFFESVGVPKKLAKDFVKCVDADKDNFITQEEFLRVCDLPEFKEVADRVQALHGKDLEFKPMTDRCMISRASSFRIAWDAAVVMTLAIVSILAPASLGFQDVEEWAYEYYVDFVIECLLLTDVVLNFRTGFITEDGLEILKGRVVARKYLKSWFLLDLVTSIPYRRLGADLNTDPRVLRLLRIGKIFKSLRLLKLTRPSKTYSHLWDRLEDFSMSAKLLTSLVILKLLLAMLLICHWLGCFMAWAAEGCLDSCEDEHTNFWRQYIASVYWAFTTVTTVGYGDISPSSNWERLTAMIGMVIGGAFYGYVIGSITNVVTNQGLSERHYNERMAEVQAWLDYHRLPPALRRRIRVYFAVQLRQSPPPAEEGIVNRLSPDLQEKLGEFMVSREVLANPLFYGLSEHMMNRLVTGIQKVKAEQGEHIVLCGEAGYAMFVVLEGQLVQKFNDTDGPLDVTLDIGDSFGEEVLCGLAERYEYDVFANEHCILQTVPSSISKKDLHPTIMETLRKNYSRLSKASPTETKWKSIRNGESPDAQGSKVTSSGDPGALEALKASIDDTRVKQEEIARSLQSVLGVVSNNSMMGHQRFNVTI